MTTELFQLFDAESSTFTYLLADHDAHRALIIDPVDTHVEQYQKLLDEHGLELELVLETHAHADHITGAGRLRMGTGALTATPSGCGIASDRQLGDGARIDFGAGQWLTALHTPGHTAGSMCYLWTSGEKPRVFTGDTLLINGCGRSDFQSGDPGALFDSITGTLFKLPDETEVLPAHDYHGARRSSIGEERANNSRVAHRSRDEFVQFMKNLNLPAPKLIDLAVPLNRQLGLASHGI